MIRNFRCKISHEEKFSEFIEVRNGVRQGCILSPTLFLLILNSMMKRVKVLRKRGRQQSMKVRLEDLDYADDICMLAQRFCDMDKKLKRLKEEAESAGLYININKTKGMRVNTSNIQKFRLENTEIKEIESFVYLGSVVSKNGGTEEDVASRIKKANGVFIQLNPVCRNHNRRRGRLRRTWQRKIEAEIRGIGKTWNEVKGMAGDRNALCSTRSKRT